MIGMAEMVSYHHNIIENLTIAHQTFWGDILLLSIDHLEWIAIIVGTEKFIHWLRRKK